MNVSVHDFDSVMGKLQTELELALDTETTGLRWMHDHRLFSVALATESEEFYFNFQFREDIPVEFVLNSAHMKKFGDFLASEPNRTWYMHNAKFDLHMLRRDNLSLSGHIHCTKAQARVEHNDHLAYSLSECLKRIGREKDDKPLDWILATSSWAWSYIPGKKQRHKNLFYYKVPYDLISSYAMQDARGCFDLGRWQVRSTTEQAKDFPPGVMTPVDLSLVERKFTRTVLGLETTGVLIDRPYCLRAMAYEESREYEAGEEFKALTGETYAASPLLYRKVFSEFKNQWRETEKGNDSFESDVLKTFDSPAARAVLTLRDAKSKKDFYNGFLYWTDRKDILHSNIHQSGTVTGRTSSSEPNLQNLTSEEASFCRACKEWFEEYLDVCPDCAGSDIKHPEFMVRRAIIPRPGFVFILPDWDQMEYKLMLDYSKEMMLSHFKSRGVEWSEDFFGVANKVRDGWDVHRATAELMGVKRKYAKTLNFLLLYGGGAQKLADALKITLPEAQALKSKYFQALPYVQHMIGIVQGSAKSRGWIRTWAGRKLSFPDQNFSYKAPNALIQGGCADVAKMTMNRIADYLEKRKSRMVLLVHDEIPCEIHESEISTVPARIQEIMQTTYPYWHVPLTAGMEWSSQSLADKVKGLPS